MKIKVNKEFVEELVRNHVLEDQGIDVDEFREVVVYEYDDYYEVDIILNSEFK